MGFFEDDRIRRKNSKLNEPTVMLELDRETAHTMHEFISETVADDYYDHDIKGTLDNVIRLLKQKLSDPEWPVEEYSKPHYIKSV